MVHKRVQAQPQWTNCIIDKILKNIEIVKFITTALKSILNLVKLQSLVAKCCKMQKIEACKICKFCILLYYARKTDTTIEKTVSIFRTQYKRIQNLQTLQGHIFHILPHFATKHCNFTKFRMLVNAVVMNFTISIFLKILSIMQSVLTPTHPLAEVYIWWLFSHVHIFVFSPYSYICV